MVQEKTKSAVLSSENRKLPLADLADPMPALFNKLGRQRLYNLIEIAAVSTVYFWVVWPVTVQVAVHGLGFFPLFIILATVVYVAFISPVFIHQDFLNIRGLGPPPVFLLKKDNFFQALRWFGSATLAGISGLLLFGIILKPGLVSSFDGYAFMLRLGIYFLSALGQDALFFGYFLWRWQAFFEGQEWNGRWQRIAAARPEASPVAWPALLANAVLFSFFHLPNLPIMVLTLVMGVVWGKIFSRTPNLLISALGHALLGTTLNIVLKVNLKIGSTYYLAQKGFYRAIFSFLDPIIDGRF